MPATGSLAGERAPRLSERWPAGRELVDHLYRSRPSTRAFNIRAASGRPFACGALKRITEAHIVFGMKNTPLSRQLHLRIDDELADALIREAARDQRCVSDFTRLVLERWQGRIRKRRPAEDCEGRAA